MHDFVPRKAKVTEEEAQEAEYERPRKANEYLKQFAGEPPPAMLFDEFWREGELGLMFGPSGAGKSLLATQIAEALARGRPIGSFNMPAKRQRVLYVDLDLSDRQFCARYTEYRFSENLFRLRPKTTDKLCEWLRKTIIAERSRYVIIDDLSAIRQTFDGTRETLKLMRELRLLKDELDVSILVLADCREPRNGVAISEHDMLRSRVLCDAADSVFAIAAYPSCPYGRNVLQTRTAYRPAWTASNAPICWIETTEDGLPGLVFDQRFTPPIDDERARLICEVKRLRDAGESYRQMAPKLGISPATASRLRKKWRPGLDAAIPGTADNPPEPPQSETQPAAFDDDEPPEWEEAGYEKPEWLEDEPPTPLLPEEGCPKGGVEGVAGGMHIQPFQHRENEFADEEEFSVRSTAELSDDGYAPPAHAGGSALLDTPRGILQALGFRHAYDKNGREIFIEREDETGERQIWYRFDQKNQNSTEEILKRVEYRFPGTSLTTVDGPVCLFNSS